MKTVLCYGDSNTHGADPAGGPRFGLDQRWPGVLRTLLGDDYWVIEEGLGGRTTVWDDPIEGHKNGKTYLPPCLDTHKPINLVIIMLGTNDLKMRFSLPAQDIAKGAGVLAEIVQKCEAGPDGAAPQILLMAPPPVTKLTDFSIMFAGSEAESQQFAKEYAAVAAERGCHFLDTGKVIVSSDLDGIHFEVGEHRKLAEAVAEKVREILS